jgi:DNA-binding NarL/FixJ family response regulator
VLTICRHDRRRKSASEDIELSQSELAILRAYAHGLSRRQIGERVGLSSRTVGHYLTVAKEKLGANNLAHAALMVVASSMLGNER